MEVNRGQVTCAVKPALAVQISQVKPRPKSKAQTLGLHILPDGGPQSPSNSYHQPQTSPHLNIQLVT